MTKLEDLNDEDIKYSLPVKSFVIECPECGKRHRRTAKIKLLGQKNGLGVYETEWACPQKKCGHSYIGYVYNLTGTPDVQTYARRYEKKNRITEKELKEWVNHLKSRKNFK